MSALLMQRHKQFGRTGMLGWTILTKAGPAKDQKFFRHYWRWSLFHLQVPVFFVRKAQPVSVVTIVCHVSKV